MCSQCEKSFVWISCFIHHIRNHGDRKLHEVPGLLENPLLQPGPDQAPEDPQERTKLCVREDFEPPPCHMWSPCRGRVGGLPMMRFSLCSLKHRDGPLCSVSLKKDNCACLGSLSNVLGSFETLHSFLWCLCGWKSACFPNELMWLEHLAPRKALQEALTYKHTCPEAHMQVQAIRCERRLCFLL